MPVHSGVSATAEYLPATEAAKQEIILLHGWGCNRDVWRPLLAHIRKWANVTLVDIPGCSTALSGTAAPVVRDTLDEIVSHCPARAVYVGWSLGGQLALEIARLMPQRVTGVVTVCSNPLFVTDNDWPGMLPDKFDEFSAIVHADIEAALRRFYSLQCAGSNRSKQLLRQLRLLNRENVSASLPVGMDWLRELDLRVTCGEVSIPQLHIFAGADGLVPAQVAQSLRAILSHSEHYTKVELLAGVSHCAPLECPADIAALLFAFLRESELASSGAAVASDFEKADVAESFSKAAGSYDAAAALQRSVGSALLARLDSVHATVESVLDLGCGTGYFSAALHERYPDAVHVGLDLAPGMVAYARSQSAVQQHWAVGDAESLPFASHSFDVIYSSLALQWCGRLDLLFAELERVLKPGGRCVFATLGPDTLKELRASWASVDERQHVNRFFCVEEITEVAQMRAGIELALETEAFVMHYERVTELLLELKALGAHNVNRNRASGLTGRAALRNMQQAYEGWRTDGLLPATYEVVFGILEAA